LRKLNLSYNSITTLNEKLLLLENLRELKLFGNKINSIPNSLKTKSTLKIIN
jgi:Leucine-rich repeat (LRR) protein